MKFKFRRYYLYYIGRLTALTLYLVPLKIALSIAKISGDLTFYLLARYRNIALANLRIAFGREKSEVELRLIARRVFENLAKFSVELINFPKIDRADIDKRIQIKNIDIVDRELKKGRGAIILTAHLGNWELLAISLKLKDYAGCVIGRRIYFDRYDGYLNSLRGRHGVNVIYRDESPKRILKALRDNWIVGILADQDVDSVDGVFVNFFGRPAYTPKGPVQLARASGASLIPAFIVREGTRHKLFIEEPIKLSDTGDREKDIVTDTQRWSDVVEEYIRRYPEQWVWVHRRWKTKNRNS